MNILTALALSLLTILPQSAVSKELAANCCKVLDPPAWLTRDQLSDIADRVERKLGWDIRRVQLIFHKSQDSLLKASKLSFPIRAFFRKKDQTVHLGAKITATNLSEILGHELVHVIFFQKYKDAIPNWLNEGLANHIGSGILVDYRWLKTQTLKDVTGLNHPNSDDSGSRYHYQASTAAVEMIAAKCSLNDLLMLSVGRSLESYLKTFCHIDDVNGAFRKWVSSH